MPTAHAGGGTHRSADSEHKVRHDLSSSRSILATEQKAVIREERNQDQLEAGATALAKVEVVAQTRGQQQWEEDILGLGLDFQSKADRTAERLNVEF